MSQQKLFLIFGPLITILIAGALWVTLQKAREQSADLPLIHFLELHEDHVPSEEDFEFYKSLPYAYEEGAPIKPEKTPWQSPSAEEEKKILERQQKFMSLPEERKRQLRETYFKFTEMGEKQRDQYVYNLKYFFKLSPSEQQKLRENHLKNDSSVLQETGS